MNIRTEVFMNIATVWDGEYFDRASVGYEFNFTDENPTAVLVLFMEAIRFKDGLAGGIDKRAVKAVRVYKVNKNLEDDLGEYFRGHIGQSTSGRTPVKEVENFFKGIDNFILTYDEDLVSIYF